MRLGWIAFFEIALVNIFLAALVIAAPERGIPVAIFGGLLLAVLSWALVWVTTSSDPKRLPAQT